MAFVKLDCGMLDSTLWVDRDARELFITALLMALPYELRIAEPQIEVRSLQETGFEAPPGWYGFVAAAGSGIIRRAGMEMETGLNALERLGAPDSESRTPDFEGRRLIRIDGGYLALNFDKYRQKDHTAAQRAKRYRERKQSRVTNVKSRVTKRNVTQAEGEAHAEEKAEAEAIPSVSPSLRGFEDFWKAYPKKKSKAEAEKAWIKNKCSGLSVEIMDSLAVGVKSFDWTKECGQFVPHPATWLNRAGWNDEFSTSAPTQNGKHQATAEDHSRPGKFGF